MEGVKKKPTEKMGDVRTLADDAAELFQQGESADYVIAFFTGVLKSMEKYKPDKTYTVTEIHELFEMLYLKAMEKYKE